MKGEEAFFEGSQWFETWRVMWVPGQSRTYQVHSIFRLARILSLLPLLLEGAAGDDGRTGRLVPEELRHQRFVLLAEYRSRYFFFRKCSSNTGVERGACCDWIPNITGRVMITNPLEGWAEEVDLTALDALLTTLSLNDCPLVCPFRTAMGDLAMAAGRRHQTEDKAAAAFRVAIGAEPTRQEAKAGTFANSYNLEQKPVATVGPPKIEPCPTWRGTTSGSASEIPSARRLH